MTLLMVIKSQPTFLSGYTVSCKSPSLHKGQNGWIPDGVICKRTTSNQKEMSYSGITMWLYEACTYGMLPN